MIHQPIYLEKYIQNKIGRKQRDFVTSSREQKPEPCQNMRQSSINYVNFIKNMFERKLETRSNFRSVRYKVNRGQAVRTADPSACNFRIKRNSCLESTLQRTNDSNPTHDHFDLNFKQMMKTDYLRSFNSMMNHTERQHRNISTQKQVSFFEDARVYIPDFEQHQTEVKDSQHALLAPFNQPYSHVKLLYSKAQEELKSQQNTCNEIRAGLRQIKQQNSKNLNDLLSFGQQHFGGIRALLRKNQIKQQEKKLKTKRELEELKSQHNNNQRKMQQLSQVSSSLQMVIFNSTPYDLKQREEYGEVYI